MSGARARSLGGVAASVLVVGLGACASPFSRPAEQTPLTCESLASRSPEFMAMGEQVEPGVSGPFIQDQAQVTEVFREEFRTAGVRGESSGAVRMLIDIDGSASGFELVRLEGADAFGTVLMNMARRIRFGPAMMGECPIPSYSEFQFAIRPGG